MQIKDEKFRLKMLIMIYLLLNLGLSIANLVNLSRLEQAVIRAQGENKVERELITLAVAPTPQILPTVTAEKPPEQKPNKPVSTSYTAGGIPSQEQKDATEAVCGKAYTNHEAEITSANVSKGLYMETCYYDLLAIARHESGFNNNAVGDSGKAHGPFQINSIYNPSVTLAQATDYTWSANWTIERMHRFGYPVARSRSIRAHNGLGGNGSYESAVKATAAKYLSMGL